MEKIIIEIYKKWDQRIFKSSDANPRMDINNMELLFKA